jgi:hypothetical protein
MLREVPMTTATVTSGRRSAGMTDASMAVGTNRACTRQCVSWTACYDLVRPRAAFGLTALAYGSGARLTKILELS